MENEWIISRQGKIREMKKTKEEEEKECERTNFGYV
jgi:hypothetical protein